MSDKLTSIINKLIHVSGNERSNIVLPNDALINKYEITLGFSFTPEYKRVLKEVGNIFFGTIELLYLTEGEAFYGELRQTLHEARKQGLPESILPICEDNGSYYCIDNKGIIRFWTPDGYDDECWQTISDWIEDVWINGN